MDDPCRIVDARDLVLATFAYWDPEAIPKKNLSDVVGAAVWAPGILRLALHESRSVGFVKSTSDGTGWELTSVGREFVAERMEKESSWYDYFLRADARPWPRQSLSVRMAVALRKSRLATNFRVSENNAQKN